jgi:hypothetical protein
VDEAVGLEGGPVAADAEAAIERGRGGGAPLPAPLRRSMENSFEADFSGVRVHTDPGADALNRHLQSRAFTVGSDIFFAKGEYQPGSRAGQRLLAHELTHTVQQGVAAQRLQRVFAPEFFMSSIVRHHFPNGGMGYQTSQVAEKMRREVGEDGSGGQDTGYGYKTKPVYHKSSGTAEGTSVSAFFIVHPTYVVAMGEHNTTTSYDLYWCNPDVARWAAGNTIAINGAERIDVANKADVRAVLGQEGYTTPFNRVGGQLGWSGGSAQGNQFTVDKKVKVDNVTIYALRGQGMKGLWERTTDSKDTVLANTFH